MKIWDKIKFLLTGKWGIPMFLIYWGLAFATFGLVKPVGTFFGILAVVSTLATFGLAGYEWLKNKLK